MIPNSELLFFRHWSHIYRPVDPSDATDGSVYVFEDKVWKTQTVADISEASSFSDPSSEDSDDDDEAQDVPKTSKRPLRKRKTLFSAGNEGSVAELKQQLAEKDSLLQQYELNASSKCMVAKFPFDN